MTIPTFVIDDGPEIVRGGHQSSVIQNHNYPKVVPLAQTDAHQ